jgi:hypothetical protein
MSSLVHPRSWRLAALWLLLMSGCGLDSSLARRCVTHADCNAGRSCVDNTCRPIDADSGASHGDGASHMDASPPDAPPMDASTRDAPTDTGPVPGEPGDADGEPPLDDGSTTEAGSMDAATGDSGDAAPIIDDDDAGDDGDEDAGADEQCGPGELDHASVALWLDAAHGVTADAQGRVQQWVDRSAHGHTALPSGDAADWPVLVSDPSGSPAVQFGAGQTAGRVRRLMIEDRPSLQFGTDDFALLAVVRHRTSTVGIDNDHSVGVLYMKVCLCPEAAFMGATLVANDSWAPFAGGGPVVSSFVFQTATHLAYVARSNRAGFNDNVVHVVAARRHATLFTVTVDGQAHSAHVAPAVLDISTPGIDVAIGANAYEPYQSLDGEIFELVALVGDAASEATTESVARCLMRKYSPE